MVNDHTIPIVYSALADPRRVPKAFLERMAFLRIKAESPRSRLRARFVGSPSEPITSERRCSPAISLNHRKCRPSFADLPFEFREARIRANWIESEITSEIDEHIRAFNHASVEAVEGLVVPAEPDIDKCNLIGIYIAARRFSIQPRNGPLGFRSSPGLPLDPADIGVHVKV